MRKPIFIISSLLLISMLFSNCEDGTIDDILPGADPVACFTFSPESPDEGESVSFNASCSENAQSYDWDFGDGESSTNQNPSHVYAAEGNYTIVLTVEDSEGTTDEETKTITVNDVLDPVSFEHTGHIEADETWVEGVHTVTGDVYVDGGTLTIEPGAVIKFDEGRGLYIGYGSGTTGVTLIAEGTTEKGITFTSSSTSKTAGDWDYIGFYEGASSACSMKYCTIEYGGGYSANYGEVLIDGSSISFENNIVQNSEYYGITLASDGFFESFINNTLQSIGTYPILIYANYAHTIGANNSITTDKGVLVDGDDYIQASETWLKLTCPYIIDGDIYVGETTGAQLSIEAGARILFTEGTGIYIGYGTGEFGTLTALGIESDSILFSSAAPEGSKTMGDWDFIGFYEGAGSSSNLDFCIFEYGGGYSANYGQINIDGSTVSLTNSTIRHSENYGITCSSDGGFENLEFNKFSNNATYPILIYGNYAHGISSNNNFLTGPGVLVKGDDINVAAATWNKLNTSYIVDGDLYVSSVSGTTITIEPGTSVKFTNSSAMYIGYSTGEFGNLIAEGTANEMIIFTSAAPVGFETAGDWDGVWFYEGISGSSIMDFCEISYAGGYSANSGNLNFRDTGTGIPVISNSTISNSEAYGIHLDNNSSPTLTNISYADNALGDSN